MGRTSSAHHVHAWLHACVPCRCGVNGRCPVHFHQSPPSNSSRIYSQLATIAVAPISSMRGAGSAIGVATGAEVAICDACASAWQSDTDVAPVRAGLWLQREKSMARAEVVSRTVCVWTSSFQPSTDPPSTETPSTEAQYVFGASFVTMWWQQCQCMCISYQNAFG